MKKLVLTLGFLLCAHIGWAQSIPNPTSWNLTIYNNSDHSRVGSTIVILRTDATCGIPKATAPTGVAANPTEVRWDYWVDPTKDCQNPFDNSTLPANVTVYAKIIAVAADGTTSDPTQAPTSNLFSRVVNLPPAVVPPANPTNLRIR